jgi:hypothetical protein
MDLLTSEKDFPQKIKLLVCFYIFMISRAKPDFINEPDYLY